MFHGVTDPIHVNLSEKRSFKNGNVLLHYMSIHD